MPRGKAALRQQYNDSNRPGGSGDNSYIGSAGCANVEQGGAPAGRWFSSDLPISATTGTPMKEGFSPTDCNDPLPPPGSSEGVGKAPTGLQR